jgi:ribosomal protein S21
MGVRVMVGEREPIGLALRRLKKQLERAGVPGEVRRHVSFVDGTEIRRAKRFRKRFRSREAALLARMALGLTGPALDEAKAEFWRRTGKP